MEETRKISVRRLVKDMIKEANEQVSPGTPYTQVRIKMKSMEEFYAQDKAKGNAFIITDRLAEHKGERLENGIYSPKFGSIWQDENAFKELYSCDCKHMQGGMYEGITCPECGTKVVFRDKNIEMTGYFYLENYYVIHPTIYNILAGFIGKKKLKTILTAKWETGGDGKPVKPIINPDTKNINKYDNIGMIEFMNRFDEILEFFYLKKKKKDVYDFIKENRDIVFTKYLPVESTLLRPFSISDEDYAYDPINRDFIMLSCRVHDLNNKYLEINEENEKIVNLRLFSAQSKYMSISSTIAKSLNKKTGHIRNNIEGGRYINSGRFVIGPMKDGKIDEVDFPYLGFLEMYKPEIVYTLTKLYQLTVNEALTLWKRATLKFDKRIYKIMEYLVENNNLYILLNRNPKQYWGII